MAKKATPACLSNIDSVKKLPPTINKNEMIK
jgi:hypothetical protein